jgi:hypothetical protein
MHDIRPKFETFADAHPKFETDFRNHLRQAEIILNRHNPKRCVSPFRIANPRNNPKRCVSTFDRQFGIANPRNNPKRCV